MSEHWYTRDGKSSHTRLTKKGTERATTLRDARVEGLLPSVSSILNEAYSPELERYKQSRLLDACLKFTPDAFSTTEEWKKAIREEADREMVEAQQFGTAFHKAMETGEQIDGMDVLVAATKGAMDKLLIDGLEVIEQEVVLVSKDMGYAGTTDVRYIRNARNGILDFKTTKTTPGEPVLLKMSHKAQIAAYHHAAFPWLNPWEREGINVYVSKTEPGRVDVIHYTEAELEIAWQWFQACCVLWRLRRSYDPRKEVVS